MARPKKVLAAPVADVDLSVLDVVIPRPHIEVIERGLQNVYGLPSAEIKLKDPELVTHWVDTSIRETRLAEAEQAGYLRARPEYLLDRDNVAHSVSPDGYVTRGPRGNEILVYTMTSVALARAQKKTEENRRMMNPGATKAQVVEAAAAKFGDEAAEYLNSAHSGPVGSVKDQYERIHRSQEGDGEA